VKLGVSILPFIDKPFKEAVSFISEAGVTYLELLDEARIRLNKERIRVLEQLKSTLNLNYTLHAPFVDINVASFNPYMRLAALRYLESSLHHASKLECAIWVLHAGYYPHPKTVKRAYEISLKSIEYLARKAEGLGLTVAVENGSTDFNYLFVKAEDFERYFQRLEGLNNVKVCLDVGHANTAGQINEFLKRLSSRIAHVHVHDNHGSSDEHLPLYEGNVDWKGFLTELSRLGFEGVVVVETMSNPLKSLQLLESLL